MVKIEKKINPISFQAILDGKKTYELRLADFECKADDILVLKEWDLETKTYTGRVIEKAITYIGKTKDDKFYSKEDIEKYGCQIISFK